MSKDLQSKEAETPLGSLTPAALEAIQDALRGLHFGQVLLVVHDSAIVQVDRTERKRLSRSGEIT